MVLQQAVAELPGGGSTVILGWLEEGTVRGRRAALTVSDGWLRNVVEHHVRASTHPRLQAAPRHLRHRGRLAKQVAALDSQGDIADAAATVERRLPPACFTRRASGPAAATPEPLLPLVQNK